jgi:site-specific DNA recombinase
MEKCAIYCRVSTKNQEINYSLPLQQEKGRQFCADNNYEPIVYSEQGSGGTLDRPEFQKMLNDIRTGIISALWIISKDRLTRSDVASAIELRDFFIEQKTKIYTNSIFTTYDTPESLLQDNILSSIAEYQRKLIQRKSQEGKDKQIDSGNQTYANPYGYVYTIVGVVKNKTIRKWSVDAYEAEIVHNVYNWYDEDLNFDQICKRLCARGYKTKRKGTWDRGTISHILRHPIYIGEQKNTKGELIKSNIYPPIIEREQWERVQHTIDGKISIRQGKYFKPLSYELSGVVKCSECGGAYYFHRGVRSITKGIKESYNHKLITLEQQECRQHPKVIKKIIIDYVVKAIFFAVFFDDEKIKKYIAKLQITINQETDELRKNIARVEENIREFEDQKKRLIVAVKNGVMEDSDIKDELKLLKNELLVEEKKLEELEKEYKFKSSSITSLINDFAEDILKEYIKTNASGKRNVYIKYFSSITIKDYDITVVSLIGDIISVNLRKLPEDLLMDMCLLYWLDQNPGLDYSNLIRDIMKVVKGQSIEDISQDVHNIIQRIPNIADYKKVFYYRTRGRPGKKKS